MRAASPPNPFGSPGKPDHQATTNELIEKAKKEYPDDLVESNKSINDTGVNRRPDVSVRDRKTDEVKKVYEAARQNKDGTYVSRERTKMEEYEKAGIPHEFRPVGEPVPK